MLLQDVVVNQKHLENVIYTNALKEIKNPQTGTPFEIDVWLPQLNLAFEFQDIYHYSTTYYARASLRALQARDELKKEQIHKHRKTLIIVPYWWSGDRGSLQATIQLQRPDLFLNFVFDDPIPFNPPPLQNNDVVPNIGELMLVGFMEHLFLSNLSGTLWWIGEKYDGIRFCWHPFNQIAYSRNGIPLSIEPSVTRNFGSLFIDGEFWSGRGLFQDAFQLVHSQLQINFALSKFITFDIPDWGLRDQPYETRYSILLRSISSCHPMLTVPGRIMCDSKEFVSSVLNEILEHGGEGVILQKFFSQYESGRSTLMYKIKAATETDEEALVVKSTSTHIKLQLPTGDEFTVPCTNNTNNMKIMKGDVVTVSSTKRTQHHLPLDPVISRVRYDITWEIVLSKYNLSKTKAKRRAPTPEYSTVLSNHGVRLFFENFAKERNFDPLLASNWYNISRKQVLTESEGETVLRKYKSSFVHALMDVFPQIGLDRSKFLNVPVNFWNDKQNQRNEVVHLAKQSGFDPLIADNWYLWNPIMAKKLHVSPVMTYYSGNRTKAIHHLFPDIGLKTSETLFSKTLSKSERRKQLIEFAKSKNIDPLVPDSWYNFNFVLGESKQIRSLVVSYYGGSWINCVKDVFFELHLEPRKFKTKN